MIILEKKDGLNFGLKMKSSLNPGITMDGRAVIMAGIAPLGVSAAAGAGAAADPALSSRLHCIQQLPVFSLH